MGSSYCPNCGNAVDQADKFCRSCGKGLSTRADEATRANTPPHGFPVVSNDPVDRWGDTPPEGFRAVPEVEPQADAADTRKQPLIRAEQSPEVWAPPASGAGAPTTPPPVVTPPPGSGSPRRSSSGAAGKKVALWIGGVVVGLIVIGALLGGGEEKSKDKTTTDTAETSASAPAPPPPTAIEVSSPDDGDVIRKGSVSLTGTSDPGAKVRLSGDAGTKKAKANR